MTLAMPIIAGQVGQILMGVTDNIMVGHLGAVPLGASAFSNSIVGVCFLFGVGLLSPISVLTARSRGGGDFRGAGEVLRHGLWIAIGTGLSVATVLTVLGQFLDRFGQPSEVVAIMKPFWRLIVWSLVPALGFQALKQFSEGLGRSNAKMVS